MPYNKHFAGPPTITLSKDSLEDVLPISGVKNKSFIKNDNDNDIIVNPAMVDEVTSGTIHSKDNLVLYTIYKLTIIDDFQILDENVHVTKDVKESILQACPDICETGTLLPLLEYFGLPYIIVILENFSVDSACRSKGSKFRIIVKVDSNYKSKPYMISISFTKGKK